MDYTEIKPWMFRSPNEHWALLFSIFLLLIVGFVLSTFNLYLAIGAFVIGLLYVRLQHAQYLGSAIKIHSTQYPEIFDLFKDHARRLRIHKAHIYIKQDPSPNAYTIGINSCSIILTSALVEQFTQRELSFAIAHELGHFKAGHTKISSIVSPLGAGNIFSNILFGFWQRKAEYSADRCALILTKDIDSGITSLMKLTVGGTLFGKINMQGYISQIKSSQKVSVALSELLVDHPLATNRIRNLLLFWKEAFKKTDDM